MLFSLFLFGIRQLLLDGTFINNSSVLRLSLPFLCRIRSMTFSAKLRPSECLVYTRLLALR